MSQEHQRARSSRSKQGLVKVNHLSKRLPQDFFISKAFSSSPKKKEKQIQPEEDIKEWYQRDQSIERSPKEQVNFIRRKKPLKLIKVSEQIQNVFNINQNRVTKLQTEVLYQRQNIILKAIKQTKKQQSRVRLIKQKSVLKQMQKQSRQRVVKSESKKYRRFQGVSKERENIVREARMSLKEFERSSSPLHCQKMNLGFDGLLTFNRTD